MHIDLQGRARRFGDSVNTDYIIASTRKKETLDGAILKRYLLETVDPSFAASVRQGDIIVAGRNFGCGSAMEVAATVILAAGIKAVVAETFARTFYRNAINNGLLPIECHTADIKEGEAIAIRVADETVTLLRADGSEHACGRLPPIMIQILSAGGLVQYVRGKAGRLA